MEEQLQNTVTAQARIDGALEAQLPAASEKFHPRGPAISQGAPLRQILDAPANLSESLLRAARQSPEKGIVYVQHDGTETFQSYPELREEAERVLTGLRKLGLQPGDNVIFQLERNQDFISVFWGCVFGGFIPVPLSIAPTYQQVNGTVRKLRDAWKLIDPRVVVSSRTLTSAIRSTTELPQAERFRVEAIDDLRTRERTQYCHVSRPDDLALLLLTSGSTGVPKAVMQSHHALLHRSAATAQKNGLTSDDVSLNWLPMDHVGGIVMCHLRDVYLGCQQIQVQTEFILGDPLKWLDLIERHRASMTWAPNFAYGLINAAAGMLLQRRWDLSSMRFIINGGEPVVAKTARRFLELLTPFGLPATAMQPAWGMSETSSAVTYSDRFSLESANDSDPFVEVGKPVPGVSLRIVDAHNKVVEEETIGFLQVKGAPVTTGYFNNPQLNQEAFTNDGWFNTGDLGFLWQGRLTITGREKDVIIVNGVNYPCHAIESTIEEMDGVEQSFTAACAVRVDGADTDELAVFFVPSSECYCDIGDLLQRIHLNIVQNTGIRAHVILPVKKADIHKTSIGKIQRRELIRRFQAGEFNVIRERFNKSIRRCQAGFVAARSSTEASLVQIWTEVLCLDQVGVNDNFLELGGDSLEASQIISRAVRLFQLELPLKALFEAPTVAAMACVILENQARRANQNDLERILSEIEAMSEEKADRIVNTTKGKAT